MKESLLFIKNIILLLGEDKSKVPYVLMVFFLSPLIEMIGLGLIAPFVTIILNPEKISDTYLSNFFIIISPTNDYKEIVIFISFSLIAVFILKGILSLINIWIIENFNLKRQVKLQTKLMKTYQDMSYLKYVSKNSSEYVEAIQNLVGTYCGVLTSFLRILSETIIIIGILLFLIFIDYKILLSITVLLSLTIYIYDKIFRKRLNNYGKIISESSRKIFQGIQEGVHGLKEIRMLGKKDFFLDIVKNNANKIYNYNIKSMLIQSAPRFIIEIILITFIMLIIIFSLNMNHPIEKIIPTLTVFAFAATRLIPSSNVLSRSLLQMRLGHFATNKLYEDFFENNENLINSDNKDPHIKKINEEKFDILEIKNINFKYPGSKMNVINDLSLDLKSGETIGLMGSSGAGKTTLVDIILGLLKPDSGEILINGNKLDSDKNWNLQVAYLPQEIFLLDASIKTNISFEIDDKLINLDKLNNALVNAQLKDMVESQPNGTETIIGENGIKVSGGQKQRLAIARAFYHGRDILIMDEATSALDYETEKEIIDVLNKIKKNKTIIVIAHRMSTLKHCDKIFEIKNGKLNQKKII